MGHPGRVMPQVPRAVPAAGTPGVPIIGEQPPQREKPDVPKILESIRKAHQQQANGAVAFAKMLPEKLDPDLEQFLIRTFLS